MSTTTINSILPVITPKNVSYDSSNGSFLTDAWTSAAGYTYGELMYVSPQIAIVCDYGIGFLHKFINGIKVLRYNGRKAEVIDYREYYNQFYSDSFIRRESIEIVSNFIEDQFRLTGSYASSSEINSMASRLVEEVIEYSRKQLH